MSISSSMASTAGESTPKSNARLSGVLARARQCGPGIISGAANDDPSCIVSFSLAGAALGYATLWTSLFTLPLVAAVQLLASRLGMVAGKGLAGVVRNRYSRLVLFTVCILLALANLITLAADLGGMADVTQMVTGVPAFIWTAVYAATLAALLVFFSYTRIERILQWLCLTLFAYVIAGVMAKPDWAAALWASILPRMQFDKNSISILVAILGATVSPYFIFWQSSQEVESEYCLGRRRVAQRKGATTEEIEKSNLNVYAGSFVSKLITYFITITAAATLNAKGVHTIGTARDAAAALEPVAGAGALWLFAAGVVGTGLLAIPVLAGSCAYAWSEALRWRASLEEKPSFAPKFYGVLLLSVAIGFALLYTGINVVQMLFWASVLNGILAPICIFVLVRLTASEAVMGSRVVRGPVIVLGWIAFILTALAALALLISYLI